MSSPGGGMSYGDDYVAARLSIDIPEGSVEGIREITQAVEAFRVSMDATNHLVSEFSTYLKEMGEASKATNQYQKNLLQTMAAFNQLTGRYGGVPGVPPSGVPGGPSQAPFGSQGDSPSSPSRPFSPSDVGFQVAQDAQKHQVEQLNQQQARGAVTAQDVINISPQSIQAIAQAIADRDQAGREQALHTQEATDPEQRMGGGGGGGGASVQQRVNRATGLAGRISNEIGPGGSMLGMAGMMVQGIEYMHRASAQVATRKPTGAHAPTDTSAPEQAQTGEAGGGSQPAGTLPDATVPQVPGGGGGAPGALSLMSLASSLKPIAGIATIMLGAATGVQMVGGAIQGMRNVASVRGGAGGEGLEATMRSKILAMNPFISQDQARQIYQSVMGEGYADASGGGADNVVMFMQDNLTKMNISVADSAKMLRTTIVGKQDGDKDSVNGAIEELRTELDTIRTLSRQSVISTPDYVKAVASLQEAMVASGASPGMAAGQAMLAEEIGSQSQVNKGQFAKGVGDIQSSAAGGALLRTFGGANVPGGLMASMVPGYLEEHGQLVQSAWNVMRHFAQQYARMDDGSEVQRRNAVGRFMRIVKSVMPDHQAANNYKAAEDLYLSLLENKEMGAAEGRVGEQPSVGTPDTTPEALPSAAFSPNRSVPDMAPPAGGGGGGGGGSPSPAYAPPAAAAPVASQQNVSVGLTPEASRLLTVLGNSNPPQVPGANKQAAYRGQSTTNSAAPGEE